MEVGSWLAMNVAMSIRTPVEGGKSMLCVQKKKVWDGSVL